MLVLTRKAKDGKDTIIVGDKDVVIRILGAEGNVRIGVYTKDESTSIHRGEVFDRIGAIKTKDVLPKE